MVCKHPQLKTFTLTSGQVLNCCPDCTKFDTARVKVLNPGATQKSASQIIAEAEPGYSFSNMRPADDQPVAIDKVGPVALLGQDRDAELSDEIEDEESQEESNLTIGAHASL